jgi:hypothetical protein
MTSIISHIYVYGTSFLINKYQVMIGSMKKFSLMMMKPLVIILRKGKNWPLKFLLLQKLSRFVCVPFYLQVNLEQLCWKIIIILNMCFAKHLLGMKLIYLLFSVSDLSYMHFGCHLLL